MFTYTIIADGACSGNPGPGGYAWVILDKHQEIFHSGDGLKDHTTNNIMELTATFEALRTIYGFGYIPGTIKLRLDSEYVLKGILEWMPAWKARGWLTANKKPVMNQEIWKRVDPLVEHLKDQGFTFEGDWVRGHSGDPWNEEVDRRAVFMRDQAARRIVA